MRKDIINAKKGHSKVQCEECKAEIRIRNVIYFKGKYLCKACRNKDENYKIKSRCENLGNNAYSLKEALDKIYTPFVYENKNGSLTVTLSFPQIIAGKSFRIKLIESDNDDINNSNTN